MAPMTERSTPSFVIHAWSVRLVRNRGIPDANPRSNRATILRCAKSCPMVLATRSTSCSRDRVTTHQPKAPCTARVVPLNCRAALRAWARLLTAQHRVHDGGGFPVIRSTKGEPDLLLGSGGVRAPVPDRVRARHYAE